MGFWTWKRDRDYYGVRCSLLARWDERHEEAVRRAIQHQPRPNISSRLARAFEREAERLIQHERKAP